MKEDILKELYETFQLKEREGQGGMKFKYVPNEDVVNRMNQVFKGDWSTEVRDKDIVDDQVVIEVMVSITDTLGKVHSHAGFGSQQIMRYKSGPNAGKIIDVGNAYKGALSKAIVNACTRWGVGLFKERNVYELDNVTMVEEGRDMVSDTAPVAVTSAPEVNTEPSPTAPDVAVAFAPPRNFSNETKPMATPNIVPPATNGPPFDVPQFPAAAPVVEKTVNFVPAPPAANKTVSAGINITQVKNDLPKVPSPVEAPSVKNTVPEMPPTPTLPFTPQSNNDRISDVQRVALNGILSMRNIEYKDLAKEAFEARGVDKPIPPKEELTYEDAVIVIKYGNDKYRKGNA